jgi:hypothetical protein
MGGGHEARVCTHTSCALTHASTHTYVYTPALTPYTLSTHTRTRTHTHAHARTHAHTRVQGVPAQRSLAVLDAKARRVIPSLHQHIIACPLCILFDTIRMTVTNNLDLDSMVQSVFSFAFLFILMIFAHSTYLMMTLQVLLTGPNMTGKSTLTRQIARLANAIMHTYANGTHARISTNTKESRMSTKRAHSNRAICAAALLANCGLLVPCDNSVVIELKQIFHHARRPDTLNFVILIIGSIWKEIDWPSTLGTSIGRIHATQSGSHLIKSK